MVTHESLNRVGRWQIHHGHISFLWNLEPSLRGGNGLSIERHPAD